MVKIIGIVSHYFTRIGVAALTLNGALSVGDTVKISGHGTESRQTVNSMQINRQPVSSAKKGDEVAIKVDLPVKEGDEVAKV